MSKKRVVVISLGGSVIIPDKVDYKTLEKFREVIRKNSNKFRFVVVCGGGSVARKYINAIEKDGQKGKFLSLSGISTTRMNARFMNYFFKREPKEGIPLSLDDLKKELKQERVVFCGALGYKPEQTSDSNAAEIASEYDTFFINITNVKGLYNKDPNKHKDAKLIKKISWNKFNKKANSLKYKPGQHFVLDQKASKIIMENQTPTYIIKNMKELDNILNKKNFTGTLIAN
jgi:uridylate kinase